MCSTRLGEDWIDVGTSCRNRSSLPGAVGVGVALIFGPLSPEKKKYDRDHVYSTAPEAATKRAIDLQIIGGDYSKSGDVRMDNPDYLKQLIDIASGGKKKVSTLKPGKVQFFIIRGGAEGFLAPWMSTENASRIEFPSETTSGKKAVVVFDENDLLAVFDEAGDLIMSARLERPLSIPGRWREKTANTVYNAWDNKEVSIYRNTNFDIPYLGLVVDEGMKKKAWVDIHKQEATNGCIFIVDPDTPDLDDSRIGEFEPKLIHAVLKRVGKKAEQVKGKIHLGKMHLVTIR
jgi:hypothetical protein